MIRFLLCLLLPISAFAQVEDLPWLRNDKPAVVAPKAVVVKENPTLVLAYEEAAVNLSDGHGEKLNKWFKNSYQHIDIKVDISNSSAGFDWRSVGLMRGTELRSWLIDQGVAAKEVSVSVHQGEQDKVTITPSS